MKLSDRAARGAQGRTSLWLRFIFPCLTLGLASCPSQRLPGPMKPLSTPLPPGEVGLHPPGPEEVIVVRHADPVRVRPAGLSSSYPLSFYSKSTRLNSGSGVYSASGGRIEVIWPGAGSIVLSGESSGIIGSESRGEPTFIFREVERASLHLREGDLVELLGGSLLSASSGPFVIEHGSREVLRVRNQSKDSAKISFRSETIQLDPGEVVDLPLLTSGGGPQVAVLELREFEGPGFEAGVRGECQVETDRDSLQVRGLEPGEVHVLGLQIRLDEGDQVTVTSLTPVPKGSSEPEAPVAIGGDSSDQPNSP